jgi:hypothetical protein
MEYGNNGNVVLEELVKIVMDDSNLDVGQFYGLFVRI